MARNMGAREGIMFRWRRRFQKHELACLADRRQSGKPSRYTKAIVLIVLPYFDRIPPIGYVSNIGRLTRKS